MVRVLGIKTSLHFLADRVSVWAPCHAVLYGRSEKLSPNDPIFNYKRRNALGAGAIYVFGGNSQRTGHPHREHYEINGTF